MLIPIVLEFGIEFKAGAKIDLEVIGRSLNFVASAFVSAVAKASAGVFLVIIKLAAYIRGTLFAGIVTASILAGFTSKFFGSVVVTATI